MDIPPYLSEKSKALWQDIERLASRKLDESDYVAIEQLCSESDIYRRAVAELADKELESERTKQVDPAVTVRNQAATNVRQAYKLVKDFVKEEEVEDKSKLRSVKNF